MWTPVNNCPFMEVDEHMKTFIANTLHRLRTFYVLLCFISTAILRGRLGPGPREIWPTKRNLRSEWGTQAGTVRGGAWTGSWEADGRTTEGVLWKSWAREADPQKKGRFGWEKGSLLWNCTKKANKAPDPHFTRKLIVYTGERAAASLPPITTVWWHPLPSSRAHQTHPPQSKRIWQEWRKPGTRSAWLPVTLGSARRRSQPPCWGSGLVEKPAQRSAEGSAHSPGGAEVCPQPCRCLGREFLSPSQVSSWPDPWVISWPTTSWET